MSRTLRPLVHTLKTRHRLIVSVLLAVLCAALLPRSWTSETPTRFLIAWNLGVFVYLFLVARMVWLSTPTLIRQRALTQSESQFVELVLVLLASIAALVAIFLELTLAKSSEGTVKIAQICLAAATILFAWFFIHTMFALHYAHDYYDTRARGQPTGLLFPGTEDPEYGDFFYAAFIIGTSGQTADVSFTNKRLRRVALIHSIFSFLFNTTMLAMTINVAAGFVTDFKPLEKS
jgi:uncharacterized membrane protein